MKTKYHRLNEKDANLRSRIFHIEDDILWSQVVAKVSSELPMCTYLGAARNAESGFADAHRLRATLVILDLYLPDISPISAVDRAANLATHPNIILLTAYANEVSLYLLAQSNVVACVWKSWTSHIELANAIRATSEGRRYLPDNVRNALAQFRANSTAFYKLLSNAELKLLPFFATGDSDAEIAVRIGVHPLTVKTHRLHIQGKLKLETPAKLMKWALERGFNTMRSELYEKECYSIESDAQL